MNLIVPLDGLADVHPRQVGGKAFSLGIIYRKGIVVPRALCLTQDVYEMYVRSTGLMERISLELGRKNFRDMRWEELWDASLRIRSMFLNTAIPPSLIKKIREPIEDHFGDSAVVVRSSAPGEDSATATFAGLHESYINVRGIYSILDHIRLVWASLWSDAALLYRKELELDVHHSTMAVIIQELIAGQKSGVVFSQDPSNEGHVLVEATYGLNQGSADAVVEADRWTLDRSTGSIVTHQAPQRRKVMCPASTGVSLKDLAPGFQHVPPLSDVELLTVYRLAMQMEGLLGYALHVEWTFANTDLYTIQVRPLSEPSTKAGGAMRNGYYSLERSFENLKGLKRRIEDELIPEMKKEAAALPHCDPAALGDNELAEAIRDMTATYQAWEKAYWKYFTAFAHGMRLFGRVYNDAVRPHDPFEFMDLLRSKSLLSMERNVRLENMASLVRQHQGLSGAIREGADTSRYPDFEKEMQRFCNDFGDLSCYGTRSGNGPDVVRTIVLRLAGRADALLKPHTFPMEDLEEYYLGFFPDDRRPFALELLNLARAGYRLREDESIYLGKIRGRLRSSLDEGRRRLKSRLPLIRDADIPQALADPAFEPICQDEVPDEPTGRPYALHMRQLLGEPAGEGIASGKARVLRRERDLSDFQAGEIIVCDELNPDMTFIMPLASGIVERSGGMLIHGAIMAREYGLPCVIGVPGAVSLIRTGDAVTVDGYLGIVIVSA